MTTRTVTASRKGDPQHYVEGKKQIVDFISSMTDRSTTDVYIFIYSDIYIFRNLFIFRYLYIQI